MFYHNDVTRKEFKLELPVNSEGIILQIKKVWMEIGIHVLSG